VATVADPAPSQPYGAGDEPRYSVQIMLPDDEQTRLWQWTQATPGATWPTWGGHVTLVNGFLPNCPIALIEREIGDMVKAFSPFELCLNQAICVEHWRRPGLWTVLLVNRNRADAGIRALLRLHNALSAALDPLKHDLFPEVSQRPYLPHLMLTWGLPRAEARALAKVATQARLESRFRVQDIWLLEFRPQGPGTGPWQPCTRKPFVLGEGGPMEERACAELPGD